MKKSLTISLSLTMFILGNAMAQNLQDELNYKKEKAELEEKMKNKQFEREKNLSNNIKTNSFIVFCDPNYQGYYAFNSGRLYRADAGRASSPEPLSSESVKFEASVPYVKKGGLVSWKGVPGNIGRVDEIWQYNIETQTIFRKTLGGTIYDNKCTVVNEGKIQ
jgi:hypothetical protein